VACDPLFNSYNLQTRLSSVFKLLTVSTVLQKLGSPLNIVKQLPLNQLKDSLEEVSSLLFPVKKEI